MSGVDSWSMCLLHSPKQVSTYAIDLWQTVTDEHCNAQLQAARLTQPANSSLLHTDCNMTANLGVKGHVQAAVDHACWDQSDTIVLKWCRLMLAQMLMHGSQHAASSFIQQTHIVMQASKILAQYTDKCSTAHCKTQRLHAVIKSCRSGAR